MALPIFQCPFVSNGSCGCGNKTTKNHFMRRNEKAVARSAEIRRIKALRAAKREARIREKVGNNFWLFAVSSG
jgi:hypothetical protein